MCSIAQCTARRTVSQLPDPRAVVPDERAEASNALSRSCQAMGVQWRHTSRKRFLALSGDWETSAGVASEPSFTRRGTDRIAMMWTAQVRQLLCSGPVRSALGTTSHRGMPLRNSQRARKMLLPRLH